MRSPLLAQRRAGLGQVDDRVDDVRHLGLGRPVGRDDHRLDAVLLQVPLGHRGNSVEIRTPSGRSATDCQGALCGHREHDPDRVGGRLGVLQLAERHDVGAGLGDPVAAGDAEVEQAPLDVGRDLLRAQEAHPVDPRVVDRRVVVAVGGPADGQVGGVEQVEGGLLQRALGQNQGEHGGRPFFATEAGRGGSRRPVKAAAAPAAGRRRGPPGSAQRAQDERGVERGHDRLPSLVLACCRPARSGRGPAPGCHRSARRCQPGCRRPGRPGSARR